MESLVIPLTIAVIILPMLGSLEFIKGDYFQTKKLSNTSKVIMGLELFCLFVVAIIMR
jgi:hypothetical protein